MVILIAMRVVYAYNWFDLAAGLKQEAPEADWGLLIAVFFAGAALAQVPAGLLARRWGTRRVTLLGAGTLGVAATLSAFSPDLWALGFLRFGAGIGAGVFFSPAIALVASLHPEGKRGLPVGAFSSAFAAGAGLGVFLPSVLDPRFGWQASLALGGLLMLGLWALAPFLIPASAGRPAPAVAAPSNASRWPAALRSRGVWAIGIAFVGLEGASLSAGQYFVADAQYVLGWSAALAGAVGALFVFPSVFGGPVGGYLTEHFTNRRSQMLLFTALPALGFFLLVQPTLWEAALIAAQFSFTFGMVYAMMYVIPPYLPGLGHEDTPLAIGVLNGVQLAGGATVSALIGMVVARSGYPPAFELLGVLVIVPLAVLALVPRTGTRPSVTTSSAA